jgi:hypothetical protein
VAKVAAFVISTAPVAGSLSAGAILPPILMLVVRNSRFDSRPQAGSTSYKVEVHGTVMFQNAQN